MTGFRGPPLQVKLWGDFACFTRPEMKVERVTYPVITPSAARGALEAIFWKPEVTWVIEEIWMLNPIRYFSMLRNEVKNRASSNSADRWREHGGGFYAMDDRAQRHTLGLRDVAYVIKAQQVLREGVDDDPAKYRDQFRRRVTNGQCFATPYLGCREFSAFFGEVADDDVPLDMDVDIGSMLLDLEYADDGSGRAIPKFFDARLHGGVLHVPAMLAEEVG